MDLNLISLDINVVQEQPWHPRFKSLLETQLFSRVSTRSKVPNGAPGYKTLSAKTKASADRSMTCYGARLYTQSWPNNPAMVDRVLITLEPYPPQKTLGSTTLLRFYYVWVCNNHLTITSKGLQRTSAFGFTTLNTEFRSRSPENWQSLALLPVGYMFFSLIWILGNISLFGLNRGILLKIRLQFNVRFIILVWSMMIHQWPTGVYLIKLL